MTFIQSAAQKVPGSGATAKNVLPIGWYVLGGVAAVTLSDTVVGPVVVAGLLAAVIYNAGQLLK